MRAQEQGLLNGRGSRRRWWGGGGGRRACQGRAAPVDERFLKDLDRVLVLHRRAVMPYAAYARKRRGPSDEREVEQYARLVGQACAERMLLYRA
ncbi:hypothetical protein ANANG_G00303180 [Anguilla anguilla]|uniref:Uncharacterized protein n=1 Tax=Anguilla anguilla TaxID=7936 RepID=A0A9D3LKZ4_ANGAN|nr:hypothetical protein ANANG_G00303180 [Anguilla anguilla]